MSVCLSVSHVHPSVCLSVCLLCPSVCQSAWNKSASIGRNSIKFDFCIYFFENLSTKFKSYSNLTRIKGTLHKAQYTYLTTPRSVFLRMKIFLDKLVQKFDFFFSIITFFISKFVPFVLFFFGGVGGSW